MQHEPPWQCLRQRGHGRWFSTLKSVLGEHFESYGAAKEQLFEYIEVFYNQQRRHSVLGYVSPAEFERAARTVQSAA